MNILTEHVVSKGDSMDKNEIDLLSELGKLKSTISLFLSAFEAEDYPADVINAVYVLLDLVVRLEISTKELLEGVNKNEL